MKEDNKVVDYYDTIADQYDESRFDNSYGQFIDYQERRILDQLIKLPADAKCLEMACGTGRLTCYATHALDASREMMKHAMERHPDVDFCQASADQTGFDNETFHTIYSFHLMMHLEPALIKDIIAEAHRILKPGGKFIFDIPSRQRRQLLHHKQESWHGGTHLSKEEVLQMSPTEILATIHKKCRVNVINQSNATLIGSYLKRCGYKKVYRSYMLSLRR